MSIELLCCGNRSLLLRAAVMIAMVLVVSLPGHVTEGRKEPRTWTRVIDGDDDQIGMNKFRATDDDETEYGRMKNKRKQPLMQDPGTAAGQIAGIALLLLFLVVTCCEWRQDRKLHKKAERVRAEYRARGELPPDERLIQRRKAQAQRQGNV